MRSVSFMLYLYSLLSYVEFFFFFFQAEDGIRDIGVTGVQTCALPIYRRRIREMVGRAVRDWGFRGVKVHRLDAPVTREVCEAVSAFGVPLLYDVAGEIGRASCRERV